MYLDEKACVKIEKQVIDNLPKTQREHTFVIAAIMKNYFEATRLLIINGAKRRDSYQSFEEKIWEWFLKKDNYSINDQSFN